MPSRAMLMSGRTLWRVPVNLDGVPLWPEVMRREGYTTFGAGKWHNGGPSFARGFAGGGAIFFGGMASHLKMQVSDYDPSGRFPAKNRRVDGRFSSELFADAAIDFLRKHRGGQPFFLYVAFTAPHDPRMPPKPYADMYDPEKIALPKNFMPQHPFDNGELRIRDELLASFQRTPQEIRRHVADYYGMITHADAQIGRILEALRETGHADDTIILFAGDNGLALGQHGLMGKQNLYEHSARVPLLIAGPGIAKGRSDALVYLYDLFPTVCGLTGLKPPDGVEGKSLVPILRGRQEKVRDRVLCVYMSVQRAIREPRWKLIQYRVQGVATTQLFDLDRDPLELKNLADDPAQAANRKRLEALLEKSRQEAGDPVDFISRRS
jgi:arylsulfatase A-like enzyme